MTQFVPYISFIPNQAVKNHIAYQHKHVIHILTLGKTSTPIPKYLAESLKRNGYSHLINEEIIDKDEIRSHFDLSSGERTPITGSTHAKSGIWRITCQNGKENEISNDLETRFKVKVLECIIDRTEIVEVN
jgi:hypothetical protein